MKILLAFLQIRELFDGHFNWYGFLLLILFVLMGLTAAGFTGFVGYKAFHQPKRKEKDDNV